MRRCVASGGIDVRFTSIFGGPSVVPITNGLPVDYFRVATIVAAKTSRGTEMAWNRRLGSS